MTGKRKAPKDLFGTKAPKLIWANVTGDEDPSCMVHTRCLEPGQARRLAAWLLRFADWADSKSKGGKGK